MTLADDLERLVQLRNSGALSEFEFETAKRKLLATEAAPSAPVPDQLASIQQQNEIAQLDRQWQIEREKYVVHGRRYSGIPSKGSSLAQGLIVGLFGCFWTILALGMTSATPLGSLGGPFSMIAIVFPAFGVIFTIAGVIGAINSYTKAQAHEDAQRAYEEERRRLQQKL